MLNRFIQFLSSFFAQAQIQKQTGPHDKCPCGSLKKYKNCHGLEKEKDAESKVDEENLLRREELIQNGEFDIIGSATAARRGFEKAPEILETMRKIEALKKALKNR